MREGSEKLAHLMRASVALLCLLAVFACVLLSGCAQQQEQAQKEPEYKAELLDTNTLKVLIAPDYAPFSAGSGNDVWGYDIAVAQEIANRLGLSLEFVEGQRSALISTLACEPVAQLGSSGTVEPEEPEPCADIALGAFAITPERDEKVDFSSWYYVGDQAVVTRKGVYEGTSQFDRAKTRIAVVKGSTCLETAKTFTDEKLIAEYSTAQKCMEALQAKEVQAVVLDLPVARHLIAHGFSDMRILEYVMTGEAYGIALPTESSHLKDAINEVIADMEEDGTLDRLASDYLK